jgi:hypothetical protein
MRIAPRDSAANREVIHVGFDLFGLNPESKSREYFRNNNWWFRRMADFVLEHVDFPEEEKRYWHSNDGQEVSRESALKIARFLRRALRNRAQYTRWIRESEQSYAEKSAAITLSVMGRKAKRDKDFGKCHHPFSWENVANFARFCEKSGGFRIC